MANHSGADKVVTLPALGTFKQEADSTYAAMSHGHSASDITSGTLNIARIPLTTTTVTLSANAWSSNAQTVSCSAVTASNTVFVSPTPASAGDYADSEIVCTAQGAGTLTFGCEDVPASAITVNVAVFG